MLRALAGLLASMFVFLALLVPAIGIWGLYQESALGITNRSGHWLLARILSVVFLLAFSLFCALVAFGLWRYMYRGREKTKLPPNHRFS